MKRPPVHLIALLLVVSLGCASPGLVARGRETSPAAPVPEPVPSVTAVLPWQMPPYSYTTAQIVLERTVHVRGYTLEWYRNRAYTCSRSGYYTFLIAYPDGLPRSTPYALWVRLHGGGLGAYGPDGTYLPTTYCSGKGSPCYLDEESLEALATHLQEEGLVHDVAMQGGFRFLVPSMCDHDLYLGLGDVEEPYNPNIDANGRRPRADGRWGPSPRSLPRGVRPGHLRPGCRFQPSGGARPP